ncbi:hypothetical protein KAM621c_38800 [Citrobacter braakii]|uniref:Uncharacterized protein n=1 Tax=Citrobacter braakii TaxID=57706 RepID=A0AAD1L741_CITBR|nr:hypothetical protein KAM621c_38800 [Citrobacter braakii]
MWLKGQLHKMTPTRQALCREAFCCREYYSPVLDSFDFYWGFTRQVRKKSVKIYYTIISDG